MFQKLAHHHQETKKVHDRNSNTRKSDLTTEIGEANEREDTGETRGAYCSWRWAVGICFLVYGTISHVLVLPFLDLTLIAVNATVGIVFAVLLSTFVLGETMIPKYDVSGLLCISVGCTGIVLFANKTQ